MIRSRLPEFQDRECLPYVSAVIKEATRWFPITPIIPPHAANTEIHYKGYHIPKGSCIIASNWWLLCDPAIYHDPDSFRPERFLIRNEPDPATVVFGFGRRICPGRFFANKSLFLTISRILALFTISKDVGEARLKLTPGLIAHPEEFPFKIAPRSQLHAERVRDIEKNNPWEQGDARLLEMK